MRARTLMIQGTGSSVGKSLITAGLCRLFSRQGLHVAPFKSQNMSLNSFVTREGHEMGRAQAVQAEAAGIEPSALMNPVLLKPSADHVSQVIVNGRVRAVMSAREYYAFRHGLRDEVMQSFDTLAARHDLIIIEGAGSPAEINLRENDLANMGMAAMADAPVLLVGDIDRGGVFASLYGTVKLLEPHEQRRVRGLIVNKFRGDVGILEPGLRQLEDLLGLPVLGVLPYRRFLIDEEDSLTDRLGNSPDSASAGDAARLDIAVIRLPRLSNFTDFAVFDSLPDVCLRYVDHAAALGRPDLLIIPGSKNTLDDMRFLEQSGLSQAILDLHAAGVPIIGICGGFQMLGRSIHDSLGVESSHDHAHGLGLLPLHTCFSLEKRTVQTSLTVSTDKGILRGTRGMVLTGYEIHMGQSEPARDFHAGGGAALGLSPEGRPEGAVNAGGSVIGTYLHGLFDNLAFTRALLDNLRPAGDHPAPGAPPSDYADLRHREYDRLADMIESHLDIPRLRRIIEDWP